MATEGGAADFIGKEQLGRSVPLHPIPIQGVQPRADWFSAALSASSTMRVARRPGAGRSHRDQEEPMPARLTAATVACLVFAWAGAAQAEEPSEATATAATATAATEAVDAEVFHGRLSYYGSKFAGRRTASGEPFDPLALTMAHKTLPFGTLVRVTNPANQRSVVVRVNDRGPSSPRRIGDVSLAAARQLKMLRAGVLHATLEVVGQAE